MLLIDVLADALDLFETWLRLETTRPGQVRRLALGLFASPVDDVLLLSGSRFQ